MTKVGAGVGLTSGGVLNGMMAYHNNKFGEEFDSAMRAFFMAANSLAQKLKRKELELQSKNNIQR